MTVGKSLLTVVSATFGVALLAPGAQATPILVTMQLAPISAEQSTASDLVIGEEQNGQTFHVVKGQNIVLKLTDHGDGGYVWNYLSSAGLGQPVHTHVSDRPNPPPGDFGFDVYTWSTGRVNPGQYTIELENRRLFGNETPTIFQVHVVVEAPTAG